MESENRDAVASASVADSWAVLVTYLQEHCPDVVAQLRPPASPDDLRLVRETMGGPLPADLVRWWQIADGTAGHASLIPQAYTPFSIEEALRSRRTWLEVSAYADRYEPDDYDQCLAAPAGSGCSGWFLPQWLPIAGDGSSDELFVDLRFGPAHGCVSRMTTSWSSTPAIWTGVSAMLADVAEAIGSDRQVQGFRLWADDEGVSWDVDRWRWVYPGGRSAPDPEQLRQRYRVLTAELRAGGFAEPSVGWSAGMIAAHVKRNTESLIATAEAIAVAEPDWDRQMAEVYQAQAGGRYRGRPLTDTGLGRGIRYDNADSSDPSVWDGYARAELPDLADDIESLADRLLATSARLHGRQPMVYARIVDDSVLLADEIVSWWGVLWALVLRQLPIRTRQLRALRLRVDSPEKPDHKTDNDGT